MDFGSLLYAAQKNSQLEKKNEVKYYKAKFEPPKKESKEKKLSDNIQRFLQKKEDEERESARKAREKKEQLLAMRDTKQKNKINKMLKTIKSANKSVLDDAVDHTNTAITLQGPDQPDEDDYGYVSQEASALYSKLMEKYKSIPDDKKKSFGSQIRSKDEMRSTKDRVRAAIEREHEEESLSHSHRRQRTATAGSSTSTITYPDVRTSSGDFRVEKSDYGHADTREKPKPITKRPPPPPALDFQQLLKLAEQKQHEPIQVEVTKVKEPERLMTSKEKKEMEERRAFLEEREKRRKERDNPKPTTSKTATPAKAISGKMEPNGRIPKINRDNYKPNSNEIVKDQNRLHKTENKVDRVATEQSRLTDKMKNIPCTKRPSSSDPKSQDKTQSKLHTALTKTQSTSNKMQSVLPSKPTPSSTALKMNASKHNTNNNALKIKDPVILQHQKSSKLDNGMRPELKKSDSLKRNESLSKVDSNKRQFPSATNTEKTRVFPPRDIINNRKSATQKNPVKRRMIIEDDDEEYDSEMDDFIDDEPIDEPNVSKFISEIFGYDRNRFREEDYDDREMESTFAQQMREEFVSKKIGMMEDLEDMRKEAEEKEMKRKLLLKKRKK